MFFQVFDRDCELISSNWNWSDEIRNGKPEAIGSKEGPTNNCEDGILVTITDNTQLDPIYVQNYNL